MATRCSGCTLLSEFDEAFVKSGEDFAARWELLCPACAAHWRYRRLMWAHVSGVLAGLAGSVLVVSGLAPVLGWVLVHMGLVVVLRWLLRALAQVGHAAAAWMLGFRILRIVIGEGRSEIEFALGDVSITCAR